MTRSRLLREILGPDGDPTKRTELLSLCFGSGDHSNKRWSVYIKATKELVCKLAGFSVNSFDKTKEYTHLPGFGARRIACRRMGSGKKKRKSIFGWVRS
jgi:hypothetical protein